jgi:hypothetical protein
MKQLLVCLMMLILVSVSSAYESAFIKSGEQTGCDANNSQRFTDLESMIMRVFIYKKES